MSKPNFIGLALDTTSNTINTKIDDVSLNISELDDKLDSVDTSIDSITTQVNTLNTKVNSISTSTNDNYIDSSTAHYVWSVDEDGNPGLRYVKDIDSGSDTPTPPPATEVPINVAFYDDTENGSSLLWTNTSVNLSDWEEYRSKWYDSSTFAHDPTPPSNATVLDMIIGALYKISLANTDTISNMFAEVKYTTSIQSGYQIDNIKMTPRNGTSITYSTTLAPKRGMNVGNAWILWDQEKDTLPGLMAVRPLTYDLGTTLATEGMTIHMHYTSVNESNGETGVTVSFINTDAPDSPLIPTQMVYSEEMKAARIRYIGTNPVISMAANNVMDAVVAAHLNYRQSLDTSPYPSINITYGLSEDAGTPATDTPTGYFLYSLEYKDSTGNIQTVAAKKKTHYTIDNIEFDMTDTWSVKVDSTTLPDNYALDSIGVIDGISITVTMKHIKENPIVSHSSSVEIYDSETLLHSYSITDDADVLQARSQWYTEAEYPSLTVSSTATVLDAAIYAITKINESLGADEKYTFTTTNATDFGSQSNGPGINLTDIYQGTSGETGYKSYPKELTTDVQMGTTTVYGNCWVIYVDEAAVAPVSGFASNLQLTEGKTIKLVYEAIYEEFANGWSEV